MSGYDYDRAMRAMEYDRICQMLADCATIAGAKEMALTLTPDHDIDRIRTRLKQTSEAKSMLIVKGYPSFGRVIDIRDAVERAEKEAVLSMRELLDIASVLTSARRLVDYYNDKERENGAFESLRSLFSRLVPEKGLENRISRAILSDDIMADEASPTLADIRRKMRGCQSRIKDILAQYTSGARAKELQDNIVTMRGGRYVIPVKAEYKNEVKGLVHDTSASGATVFIEPMSVVNENNELRVLESKEAHEIERILTELSGECAAYAGIILSDYRALNEIAFIFAKAELSNRMRGNEPLLSTKRQISLRSARHPLIDKTRVVPVSITLGKDYDTMVITGPNTGGKTVTLKTLGLFALMVQSGLHIPAEPDSQMCIFDKILADIGDEQSIEQSLSTFSSHMVKIVQITETVDDRSLVLLDELGAGTDPTEGAALAIAVIERVRAKGALCGATTHYAELKAYALETAGVVNAGCEFDVETLRPTYRLIVGAPGKSNAFAISLKLGLDESIIEAAQARIGEDDRRFETIIEELDRNRVKMEEERRKAEQERREYEAYRDREMAKLQAKIAAAEKELDRTREKATQIMESARVSADFVMAELERIKKKQESESFARDLADARAGIRRSLREAGDKVNPVNEGVEEDYVPPRPLQKGDRVLIMGVGTEGVIVDDPDKKGNVTVRCGMVNTRTKIAKLKLLEEAVTILDKDKKKIAAAHIQTTIAQTFMPSIDLRGELGDDAWYRVDHYLDDARVAGVHTVTLIHGKGTGALRTALQGRLKRDPRVKSYRNGNYGEGDAGVTVVELK